MNMVILEMKLFFKLGQLHRPSQIHLFTTMFNYNLYGYQQQLRQWQPQLEGKNSKSGDWQIGLKIDHIIWRKKR